MAIDKSRRERTGWLSRAKARVLIVDCLNVSEEHLAEGQQSKGTACWLEHADLGDWRRQMGSNSQLDAQQAHILEVLSSAVAPRSTVNGPLCTLKTCILPR